MSEVQSPFWRPSRIAVAALLLVAGGVAFVVFSGRFDTAPESPAPPATGSTTVRDAVLTVTAAELEPVELARNLTIDGSVSAWQDVIISPEVGGYRVAEVLVDVGDRVERGQRLVELSTAILEAEVATKQALLSQRQAELANAEAMLRRGTSLSAMSAVSESDLDALRTAALTAEAGVASARADLDTARLRLKFTEISAPDDGIITSRTINVGQIAQAGGEMLRLMRQSRVEWRGEVPEAQLAELRVGQMVKVITVDGTEFSGSIRIVAPTISSINRTGLVYVDLPSNEQLRPGMFARGQIEISRSAGFAVPLQSVVIADGYSYVFVLGKDNIVERRRIETAAVRNTGIEVISGIEAGEMIVENGAGFLRDGDLVNVVAASGS
jgi:HlyD family secretion protein